MKYLLLLGLAVLVFNVKAQLRGSRFNLNDVVVRLTDGYNLHGTLVDINASGIVFRPRENTSQIRSGNYIELYVKDERKLIAGVIEFVNDTSLVVRTKDDSLAPRKVQLSSVRSIKCIRLPDTKEAASEETIPVARIWSISIHRKGTGFAGFMIGGTIGLFVGVMAGGLVQGANMVSGREDNSGSAVAITLFLIGPIAGTLAATSGKTRVIQGNSQKLEELGMKIRKR